MSDLGISLWITLVGMSLVFGVILLLWVLLAVLVPLGKRFTAIRASQAETLPAPQELEEMQLAAAVAVALELSGIEGDQPSVLPLPPTAVVTPWQALTRSKSLNSRGPVR
jgi:Na+-transporting methylmalonyl-CoA/oxaloacetate decarboxylase gamma subunit